MIRAALVTALAWLQLAAPFPQSALSQPRTEPYCPAGVTSVHVQPLEVVIARPVRISAYVSTNTVIVICDGLSINITNAPLTVVTDVTRLETSRTLVTR